MGLKSKVRIHTETTEATLTTRGREILSREGKIDATKYILSDEEIDYSLWDKSHPNGTVHYGSVLKDTPMLEATPHRTKFSSQLIPDATTDISKAPDGSKYSVLPLRARFTLNVGTLHLPSASPDSTGIRIQPTTTQRVKVKAPYWTEQNNWWDEVNEDLKENYLFTIENTNVVRFSMYIVGEYETDDWIHDIPGSGDVLQATSIAFLVQRLKTKAATTITVHGEISGITRVVSIVSMPDSTSDVFAGASPVDATDPKFY